jgi:hypothetical protein
LFAEIPEQTQQQQQHEEQSAPARDAVDVDDGMDASSNRGEEATAMDDGGADLPHFDVSFGEILDTTLGKLAAASNKSVIGVQACLHNIVSRWHSPVPPTPTLPQAVTLGLACLK